MAQTSNCMSESQDNCAICAAVANAFFESVTFTAQKKFSVKDFFQ